MSTELNVVTLDYFRHIISDVWSFIMEMFVRAKLALIEEARIPRLDNHDDMILFSSIRI